MGARAVVHEGGVCATEIGLGGCDGGATGVVSGARVGADGCACGTDGGNCALGSECDGAPVLQNPNGEGTQPTRSTSTTRVRTPTPMQADRIAKTSFFRCGMV